MALDPFSRASGESVQFPDASSPPSPPPPFNTWEPAPCPPPTSKIYQEPSTSTPFTTATRTPARSYARARLHVPHASDAERNHARHHQVPTPLPVSTFHRPPTLSQITHASLHVPQASDTESDHARQPVPTPVLVSTFHRPPTLTHATPFLRPCPSPRTTIHGPPTLREITHASPFLRPCPSPRSTGLRH